eukprot:GHVT01010275.1.p1 GENE.GHVT01010275.1~~GHVT01010275.1.p1  ORF type:complete len:158 (-),score=29.57 GHVT01010275.1:808-1281(-)
MVYIAGRSRFAVRSRRWFGIVHTRPGSYQQVKLQKGFAAAQFATLGLAIKFARLSKNLRPETLGFDLGADTPGKAGGLIRRMERSEILPSAQEQLALETRLGVALTANPQRLLLRAEPPARRWYAHGLQPGGNAKPTKLQTGRDLQMANECSKCRKL